MKTITLCSSASFYKQMVEIESQLESLGYKVLMPEVAYKMKQSGDYVVNHYKTWFGNADDYHKKTALIKSHFTEIETSDAVLVLNYEKRGAENYIGGNVLMEMAVAFYLQKPIYLLNDIPKDSAFLEEVIALQSIPLHGNLDLLQMDDSIH